MTFALATAKYASLRFVGDTAKTNEAELSLTQMTQRMRGGDDDAWLAFHRRYYLPLLRYAGSRGNLRADCSEIMQLVYLRVARHIKSFEHEIDFWRWLTCVTRCVIVDHQRGIGRRASLLEKFAHWQAGQGSAVGGGPERTNANAVVVEAFAGLPPEDAQLLRLKYLEGWSVQQLAVEIGVTSKAIENRLARLRQRLRE